MWAIFDCDCPHLVDSIGNGMVISLDLLVEVNVWIVAFLKCELRLIEYSEIDKWCE